MPGQNHPSRQPSGRRWFQFSVSALLIATAVAAVLVAWQRERLSRWVESLFSKPTTKAGPAFVVSEFLELKRVARHVEADRLLSKKARDIAERVSGHFSYMDFSADEFKTITWNIKERKVPEARTAHVETTLDHCWVKSCPDELTLRWLLRQEPTGWRITGAIVLFNHQEDGLILDFENELQMRRMTVNVN